MGAEAVVHSTEYHFGYSFFQQVSRHRVFHPTSKVLVAYFYFTLISTKYKAVLKDGVSTHFSDDLIDGSVGQCWSKYRKAFDWIQPTILFPIFFGDSRDAAHVQVHGYKNSELPHFRDWLENIYTLERLPKYLTGKYGQLMKRD
jgi:hypothetical protein